MKLLTLLQFFMKTVKNYLPSPLQLVRIFANVSGCRKRKGCSFSTSSMQSQTTLAKLEVRISCSWLFENAPETASIISDRTFIHTKNRLVKIGVNFELKKLRFTWMVTIFIPKSVSFPQIEELLTENTCKCWTWNILEIIPNIHFFLGHNVR